MAQNVEIERLKAELHEARQALKGMQRTDDKAEIAALERIISQRLGPFPLPGEELRLHVGAKVTASNFLGQGLGSSDKVLSIFGETPTEPILDWGCGSGRTLRWLHAYPAWRTFYRGVDVDGMAVDWLRSNGAENLKVCEEGTIALPYETNEMGGVFSFSVLTHIPPQDFRDWFAEIARIMRPGALAYLTFNGDRIIESQKPHHQTTADEFRAHGQAWLENEGHYKSAAFVTHDFVRAAAEGIFEVKKIERRDYSQMDALYGIKI